MAGIIDLTAEVPKPDPVDVLGATSGVEIRWADLYKARPRAPLTCRECGHGLHAKVSRTGMRFFAHDPGAPKCGLVGESLAHRLLKIELASAIRAAGWHAELEVPGNGWRADVLAFAPAVKGAVGRVAAAVRASGHGCGSRRSGFEESGLGRRDGRQADQAPFDGQAFVCAV